MVTNDDMKIRSWADCKDEKLGRMEHYVRFVLRAQIKKIIAAHHEGLSYVFLDSAVPEPTIDDDRLPRYMLGLVDDHISDVMKDQVNRVIKTFLIEEMKIVPTHAEIGMRNALKIIGSHCLWIAFDEAGKEQVEKMNARAIKWDSRTTIDNYLDHFSMAIINGLKSTYRSLIIKTQPHNPRIG